MIKKFLYFIIAVFIIAALILMYKVRANETPEQKQAGLDKVREEAYYYALSCSRNKNPDLKFKQINWVVVPGSKLHIQALDGSIDLAGYFSPNDSTIYIPETKEAVFWILAHESLHAIGYRGHDDFPFKACNLAAEQH